MSELTKEEVEFAKFERVHARQYPPPERPGLADWRSLGLFFYGVLFATIALLVAVGIRTGSVFYERSRAAFGDIAAVAEFEAVLFILGIEGLMFFIAAQRSAKDGSITEDRLRLTEYILLVVSIVAGFAHTTKLHGLPADIQVYVDVGVDLVLTSASIAAWFAGQLVGARLYMLDQNNISAVALWEKDMDEWRSQLINRWNASAERKVARAEINAEADGIRSVRRPNEYVQRTRSNLRNSGSTEVRDSIIEYAQRVYATEGRIPGPSEVESELNCSRGYASDVIKEWREEVGV